jgi:amino-acid N-acetyltransferase
VANQTAPLARFGIQPPAPQHQRNLGQLRGLARAGFAADNDDLVLVHGGHDFVTAGRDRQAFGEVDLERGVGQGENFCENQCKSSWGLSQPHAITAQDAQQPMSTVFNFTFVPWFRSVAPYIHMHRGKTFVVGIAGEAIAAGKLGNIAQDLALIQSMGVKVVLVHGFRPQVNEQLAAKGHVPKYSHGMRITDEVALDCAQEAAGQLRYEIEAAFSQGLPNTPMAGSTVRVISGNFITARPVGIVDGVDFQHSGLVRKVDVDGIMRTLDMGAMVLLSPFGFSPTGEAFNLTMEEVATSVAAELQADKLIFVTEIPGIRIHPGEPASDDNPIDTELPLAAAKKLLAESPNPTQPTDLAFYLQHCVKACEEGVERSHILPFAVDGALLLEVYVHDGIGTMVVDEKLEELREATADDVGGILQLIEPFEKDGTLVKRDRTEIERDVDHYTIIEHDGVIFACAALYPYPEAKTAEMAAVTVSPQSQGQGDGEKILKRIEQRARAMGLKSIFVLTTRTMHWFIKRGFVQVDPDWLPEARKRKYNWDRKSLVLVKKL